MANKIWPKNEHFLAIAYLEANIAKIKANQTPELYLVSFTVHVCHTRGKFNSLKHSIFIPRF